MSLTKLVISYGKPINVPHALRRGDEIKPRIHDLDAYYEVIDKQQSGKALTIGDLH